MGRPPDRLEPWEVDLWYSAIAILQRNTMGATGEWEDARKQEALEDSMRGEERTALNGQAWWQGWEETL